MKLTEILYEDVKDIWDGYLKHPFVSGIGDGSLSIERFRFYMLQDYLYLYDYARVYALGIVKSGAGAGFHPIEHDLHSSWFGCLLFSVAHVVGHLAHKLLHTEYIDRSDG